MKTDKLPKIRLRTQLSISANHYVVYVSKCVATEDCMELSWELWQQMRKSIYVQVDDNLWTLIDNENI